MNKEKNSFSFLPYTGGEEEKKGSKKEIFSYNRISSYAKNVAGKAFQTLYLSFKRGFLKSKTSLECCENLLVRNFKDPWEAENRFNRIPWKTGFR